MVLNLHLNDDYKTRNLHNVMVPQYLLLLVLDFIHIWPSYGVNGRYFTNIWPVASQKTGQTCSHAVRNWPYRRAHFSQLSTVALIYHLWIKFFPLQYIFLHIRSYFLQPKPVTIIAIINTWIDWTICKYPENLINL
jgi:hypothetical protein